MSNPKPYTLNIVLEKAQRYCSYQERCHSEVWQKLKEWQVEYSIAQQCMALLVEDNFLNEERFAKAYARGKHQIKKWGWKKIELELKRRQISEYCIAKAKDQITGSYWERLEVLAEKKAALIKAGNPFEFRKKLGSYLINKGYEPNYVWELMKNYPK